MMEITNKEVVRFFWEASLRGYASGAKPQELKCRWLPGAKGYEYSDGAWQYVDAYVVGEDERSWGVTAILYRGKQIFWMSYGGRVLTEALQRPDLLKEITPTDITAFLKEALMQYYRTEIKYSTHFNCGRGPESYVRDPFMYKLRIRSESLKNFVAEEEIFYRYTIVFEHYIQGGLLIEPKFI